MSGGWLSMTMETIIAILGSNAFVALFSYLTGKRKADVETDNTILSGLEQSVSIYREIIEDLRLEIEKLNAKIEHLEGKIEELYQENKRLKTNI